VPKGRLISLWVAAALLLAGPLLAVWLGRQETSAGPCVIASGPFLLPDIQESSGLAVSRRTRGLLWTHNDSGNAPILFALGVNGTVQGRVRVPIRARDWEDVSAAPCPSGDCLYVADIGDNQGSRKQVRIYRVPEPAAGDAETAAPETFIATYADGPHNAEALFVIDTNLFIVTRDRIGGVYRATLPQSGDADLTFQRVGALQLAAVTDAETSRDGTTVVVRTSHEAVLYRAADFLRGVGAPYLRIPIDGLREPQGEGVALDGQMLYLSSESGALTSGGRFVALRCELPR
jgi:hypothetical protein